MDLLGLPGIPRPGDVIAGRYRVDGVIAHGGMGCVLSAEHTAMRRQVAIKVLLPEALDLDSATERFLREARAAGNLRSEHVVRVLDVDMADSGMLFMIMEYLPGQDLRQVIHERAPLPVEEVADYLLQACEGILEAHTKGIIHRDLKPGNIFVTTTPIGRPLVKVLDFGLAKIVKLDPVAAEATDKTITNTKEVIGSPPYMSPEQIRSLRNADVRSDIWALGVVAYELLTGERPFRGEGNVGVMASIVADAPVRARSLRPDLPEELDALVMQCLSKDPSRRPQSVAEIITALAPFGPSPQRVTLPSMPGARIEAEPTTVPLKATLVSDGTTTENDPSPPSTSEPLTVADVALEVAPEPVRGPQAADSAPPSARPALPQIKTRPADTTRRQVATSALGTPLPTRTPSREATTTPRPAAVPDLPPSTAPIAATPAVAVRSEEANEPSAEEDAIDSSSSSTLPQRSTDAGRRQSRWLVLGLSIALAAAGAVGVRAIIAQSSASAAPEQANATTQATSSRVAEAKAAESATSAPAMLIVSATASPESKPTPNPLSDPSSVPSGTAVSSRPTVADRGPKLPIGGVPPPAEESTPTRTADSTPTRTADSTPTRTADSTPSPTSTPTMTPPATTTVAAPPLATTTIVRVPPQAPPTSAARTGSDTTAPPKKAGYTGKL